MHWLIAFMIIGLFVSGIWMVGLDYYSEWYTRAPHWHKSIGLILFAVLIPTIVWRRITSKPAHEPGLKSYELLLAKIVQSTMTLLCLAIIMSGYLITTANGDAVSLFNWFEIPAIVSHLKNQEDIAGEWHEIMAFVLIALAVFHALAALLHHFIKKDRTLLKMLLK